MTSSERRASLADNRWQGGMDDARVHRLWQRVEPRITSRSPGIKKRQAVLGLAAASCLAALGLWLLSFPQGPTLGDTAQSPALAQGAVLRTQRAPMDVSLSEGSQLSVGSESKVELVALAPERVELRLSTGAVTCDVARNPRRSFAVVAGDVEVHVIGTRFSVQRSSRAGGPGEEISKVEVSVERGRVEVRRRGRLEKLRSLGAGETWSSEEHLRRTEPRPPSAVEQPRARPAPDAGPPDKDSNPLPEEAALASQDPAEAEPHAQGQVKPRQAGTPALGSAQALFERATSARRLGSVARAAALYEQFLREYRGDPRSGLAAFELGRLQMDSLGTPGAALGSLRSALRLSPGGSFREDVLARIARAHAQMGQGEACAKARAAYQKEYPSGIHSGELSMLCP